MNSFINNFLIIFLISFLLLGFISLISKFIHAIFGYLTNRFLVFILEVKLILYFFLVMLSWLIHRILLKITILLIGFAPITAILIVMPLLTIDLLVVQKTLIFK